MSEMSYTPISSIKNLTSLNDKLTSVVVPRNFLLLDELTNSKNYAYVNYGLADIENDLLLNNWTATIFTDAGDIYNLTFTCDDEYPESRPSIMFPTSYLELKNIRLICNNDGSLKNEVLEKITWSNKMTLGDYLMSIRARVIQK